jgi:hypothetical protein
MPIVKVEIEINQKIAKTDFESDVTEEFEETFFDPDPYFMKDAVPEDIKFEIKREEIKLTGQEKDGEYLAREIQVILDFEVENQEEFKKFLEEEDCLYDDEFDPQAFALHLMGDWEGVLVDDESIDIDYEVTGTIAFLESSGPGSN